MSRLIVELRCQRIPKKTVYDGSLVIYEEKSEGNCLGFPFKRRELRDVAVDLHHAVRLASSRGEEFSVQMVQSAAGSSRPPVKMRLDLIQVNKIYESPESAQIFFSPRFRELVVKKDETIEDVVKETIDDAAERR